MFSSSFFQFIDLLWSAESSRRPISSSIPTGPTFQSRYNKRLWNNEKERKKKKTKNTFQINRYILMTRSSSSSSSSGIMNTFLHPPAFVTRCNGRGHHKRCRALFFLFGYYTRELDGSSFVVTTAAIHQSDLAEQKKRGRNDDAPGWSIQNWFLSILFYYFYQIF